jgi:hypothetical protein
VFYALGFLWEGMMTTLDIAHIQRQGKSMIIVPLDESFDHKTSSQRQASISAIQRAAIDARLAGTVVPVWEALDGRMRFIAPQPWHPFFQSIDIRWVMANVNQSLTW